jgi:hypothetical protein
MESELFTRLTREHRELDELFGRFLAASAAADPQMAHEALRRHTALEEEKAIPAPEGRRLVPDEAEDASRTLHRELRLEHVQVREVSAMILRLLEEKNDLEGARRLAPNLARRWDAHTTREERELFRNSPSGA